MKRSLDFILIAAQELIDALGGVAPQIANVTNGVNAVIFELGDGNRYVVWDDGRITLNGPASWRYGPLKVIREASDN